MGGVEHSEVFATALGFGVLSKIQLFGEYWRTVGGMSGAASGRMIDLPDFRSLSQGRTIYGLSGYFQE